MALAVEALRTPFSVCSDETSEDFSDDEAFSVIALTPGTTVAAHDTTPASSASSTMQSAEVNISLEDLVIMVKNQGDQLAANSEEMKKLKADNVAQSADMKKLKVDNAALQRQLDGKCEDDKILHNAQHGHVSYVEKLVEAKFDGMKEIFEIVSLLKSKMELTVEQMSKTNENLGDIYDYIKKKNTEQDTVRADAASKAEVSYLSARDAGMTKELEEFRTTHKTLLQKQQTATEDISSLEATIKDLGEELRMDVVKIKEQLKLSKQSQEAAFTGLEVEIDRLREFGSIEEYFHALDAGAIVNNPYFNRVEDDLEWLRNALSAAEDWMERYMDARVEEINEEASRPDEDCAALSNRLCELEEERAVTTATQKSVSDKLDKIDAEFARVNEAFAEAGRQSWEASQEIATLKLRQTRDDSWVLTPIRDLEERFEWLKQSGKTPAIADLEEKVNQLSKDAKTTHRAVEEQSQLIWSLNNKFLCSGDKIEKKVQGAERRISDLEPKAGLRSSGTDTSPQPVEPTYSKSYTPKATGTTVCHSVFGNYSSLNKALGSLIDAEDVDKLSMALKKPCADRQDVSGFEASTVIKEDDTPPTDSLAKSQNQDLAAERPLLDMSAPRNAPSISIIQKIEGVDADAAAAIQRKIEAAHSQDGPMTLRPQAADFKPVAKMTEQEYEASQEDLAGWVSRHWPDGGSMYGEWGTDDVYVGLGWEA